MTTPKTNSDWTNWEIEQAYIDREVAEMNQEEFAEDADYQEVDYE
jgi:hypothetical protein